MRIFKRRRAPDSGTLDRVLAAAVPDGLNAAPFEASFPVPPALSHLLSVFPMAGFVLWIDGHGWIVVPDSGPRAIAFVGVALAIAGAALAGVFNPARRLRISESGITLERLFGSTDVAWYRLRGVRIAPDVSRMVLDAPSPLMVELGSFDEARRVAVVDALRARLSDQSTLAKLEEGRVNRRTVGQVISIAASVVMLVAFVSLPRGGALGVRCSGPSAYLSNRFDVPHQPGCVFIRVSGATARAGIHRGDEMIALDGTRVTSGPQFNGLFDNHSGRSFKFTIVRAGTYAVEDVTVSFGSSGSIDSPPDDPITHFLTAKSDLGEHPDVGLREYSRAIELAPDFDLAFVGRAQIRWSQRQYPEAIADFRLALALDPKLPEAMRGLALVLTPRDGPMPQEAGILANEAVVADACPSPPEPNLDCSQDEELIALDLLFRFQLASAIEHAQTALAFDPKNAFPHSVLARAHLWGGDTEAARTELAAYEKSPARDKDLMEAIRAEVAAAVEQGATPVVQR